MLRLIDDVIRIIKRGWCQHHSAVDKLGRPCGLSLDAVSYCLYGAFSLVAPDNQDLRWEMNYLLRGMGYWRGDYVTWQDTPGRTKEEVLMMLGRLRKRIRDKQNS